MNENRTNEQIITEIKELIQERVKPAVAGHGGNIEFLEFNDGRLLLELGGACSGCAGSTMTLKMGIENMLMHYVPEIKEVDAVDDPFSNVDPFYTEDFFSTENLDDPNS
jgi:NFU1 iron-sulfur cluster scaffold homolog, mitochondrial